MLSSTFEDGTSKKHHKTRKTSKRAQPPDIHITNTILLYHTIKIMGKNVIQRFTEGWSDQFARFLMIHSIKPYLFVIILKQSDLSIFQQIMRQSHQDLIVVCNSNRKHLALKLSITLRHWWTSFLIQYKQHYWLRCEVMKRKQQQIHVFKYANQRNITYDPKYKCIRVLVFT